MIIKIFVLIIYFFILKLLFNFIMLLKEVLIKKDKKKAMMHKFECPYCGKYNEILITTESVFFISKFLPFVLLLMVVSLITILIPFRHLTFIREILMYVILLHAIMGLVFGGVSLLGNVKCKKKNVEPQNELILKVASRLFNVRKSQCTHCKMESYRVTGY